MDTNERHDPAAAVGPDSAGLVNSDILVPSAGPANPAGLVDAVNSAGPAPTPGPVNSAGPAQPDGLVNSAIIPSDGPADTPSPVHYPGFELSLGDGEIGFTRNGIRFTGINARASCGCLPPT